jgi:hypothetical protein
LVTFWSTLISTLILLPVAAYTSSSTTALSFTQALAVGTIGIVPGVVSEIFEELYVDPYIEAWVSAQVYAMGGDEKAAQLWSMFVTSFREALFGGVSGLIEMMGSSSSDTSIDVNIDVNTQQQQQQSVESQLTAQKQKAENTLVDIESNKAWKSLFNIENLIGGIATAIPSLFIGGGDLGALSMALDLSTDIIQTKLQNYYMKGILNTHIAQIDRTFEILEALKPRPALDTSAINVAWLFVPRVEVVSSVASEAELMTASSQYAYPAPMMSMGPVFEFNHKQTKEAIEKLNELEGAVSEELKKVQNEYDSVELGKLDVTINSYKELMYEKHTVFVDIGPYGGVNYRVLEIIMDKSSKGETLTDLEKFILSEGAKRMGGQGAPLNPQETPIDPVLTEIYLKLEQRHEDQLIEYIKARASLLKHLEFDFGSLANSLDSSISVLPIVTSIDDFINIEFKKQFDLRFSNDLKINELVNVKLSEDGSSSIEFVFLDKLIKKSTDSFEKLYLRICKAVMEVFADPQRSSQASYIKRIFGSADNLIITTLERPYQVTKVSLIMGMGRAYLTDTLQRSDRPLDARAMIYFKTIAQKIQPALDKAFGRDVSMGIISEYLGEQGRRFQLLYSLYSLVTEKTGQYYTQGAFSKILFGKEDKVSILLRTPNPMIGDINSMWTLEYLATQAKPRPRLGFNPNKETLKSIIDETKKIIHKTITNQISGSLSPLAVKMIFDSLYALSEKGGFYNLGRLSKLIDRHESKLYLVGKVLGAGRNPADSVVSTLLELLVTEEVSAEHEAFKSANLFLQTRGLEYLDFDFYVKKFIELSGPRVSDSSILSPEEVLMAKTIVWGISGGRSWVTGEQINYDETVLHHILHDPKSHLTLYGLDHENKFSYFAAVTAGENTGELEGKNKKVHENELLYMWEQIRAGNYYEATRHWKNKQWRRDFARQATSLNYIDNWVKRLS